MRGQAELGCHLAPLYPHAQLSRFYPWFYLYVTHVRSVPRHSAFSYWKRKKAGTAGYEGASPKYFAEDNVIVTLGPAGAGPRGAGWVGVVSRASPLPSATPIAFSGRLASASMTRNIQIALLGILVGCKESFLCNNRCSRHDKT